MLQLFSFIQKRLFIPTVGKTIFFVISKYDFSLKKIAFAKRSTIDLVDFLGAFLEIPALKNEKYSYKYLRRQNKQNLRN